MSVTEVGPQPNAPEIVPLPVDPRAVALHNALTFEHLWPDSHHAERQSFPNLVEQACATTVNPNLQEAIRLVGQEVEWRLYAKPGEPLPDHLVLVPKYYNDACNTLNYHPRSPVGWHETKLIIERYLMPHGLANRLEVNANHRRFYQDLIHQNIVDIVKSTPGCQLLASFGIESPQTEQQPLTPYWRQIREAQDEASIRTQFAIAEGQPIPLRSPADHARRRSQQQLDDETMPNQSRQTQPEDGFSRARAYFSQIVCEPGDVIMWPPAGSKEVEAYVQHADGTCDNIGELLWEKLNDQFIDARNNLRMPEEFSTYFVNSFAHTLFTVNSNPDSLGYTAYLETYTNEYVSGALPDNSFIPLGTSELNWAIDSYASGVAWRKQALGPVVSNLDYSEINLKRILVERLLTEEEANEKVGNCDRLQYEADKAKRVGVVREHLSTIVPSRAERLIQSQQFRELPAIDHTQPNLLVINFGERVFDDLSMPLIPGYITVGHNASFGETFAFIPDTEHDPYQTSGAPLGNLKMLIQSYRSLGLESLATVLESGQIQTVDDLAQAIAQESVYSFGWEYISKPQSIDEFAPLVKDGRLNVQCNGAANFLRLSLNQFGRYANTSTTSGYVLPANSSRIDGARHQQTIVTHQGKPYIIDATPSLPPEEGYGSENGAANGNTFRQTASVSPKPAEPAKPKLDRTPVPEATYETPAFDMEEVVKEHREKNLAGLRQSLEAQLQIVLQQPNQDTLYKFVSNLPQHDPIRRTLSTAIQASQPSTTTDDAVKLVDYLQAVANATPQTLRKLRLTKYDPALFAQLQAVAERLVAITKTS